MIRSAAPSRVGRAGGSIEACTAALADGVDLADVAARVPMPHFAPGRGFAASHAVNVRREFARQERALLRAAP